MRQASAAPAGARFAVESTPPIPMMAGVAREEGSPVSCGADAGATSRTVAAAGPDSAAPEEGRSGRALLAVPVAAALAAALLRPLGLDEPLFRAANALPRVTGEALWSNLTLLGSGEVAAVLLLPLLHRRPRVLFALVLGALLLWAGTNPLKEIVEARRPHVLLDGVLVIGPAMRKNAFPSGHTGTAFALAVLVLLTARHRLPRVLALLAAGAVALSRLATGAHFPVDVAAGIALGWTAGLAGHRLAARWRWGLRPSAQLAFRVLLLLAALDVLVGVEEHPAALPLRRALGVPACLLAGAGVREALRARRPAALAVPGA